MKSIKTKIMINLFLLITILVGISVFYDFQQKQLELYTELKTDSLRKSHRLSKNLILPLWELDELWIDDIINTEMLDNRVYGMVVTGADGLRVAKIHNTTGSIYLSPKKAEMLENNAEFTHFHNAVVRAGEEIGQLTLYIDDKDIIQQLQNSLNKIIINTLISSCITGIVLWMMLMKIIVSPLRSIVMSVEALEAGKHHPLVSLDKQDEIGVLARGLESLRYAIKLREKERDIALGELIESKKSLLILNQTLELKVTRRTQDLEDSNENLLALAQALEISKDEAEAANHAKSIFLSNMSHELRTPMNAVLGFSELLQDDENLTVDQREDIRIINKSGNHLLNLINDILDMAKIEAGHASLEYTLVNLEVMIYEVMDMMSNRAEKKALKLIIFPDFQYDKDIRCDAGKLKQVLINLISNAIKCTETGSITLKIDINEHSDKHYKNLCFDVTDTGIGISEEELSIIFNAFMQVGDQTMQNGTGLGLAITKKYIELMKGHLTVNSQVGEGSTFSFELPVECFERSENTQITVDKKVMTVIGEGTKKRILIVEDQLENRLLLVRLLRSAGFTVAEAENGEEAVAMFQNWNPDFIWMDKRMPVMDGMAATRRIRALPQGHDVVIVAVTASVFEEEHAELLAVGVDEILHKPYRDNEIFDCMAYYLNVEYLYKGSKNNKDKENKLSISLLECGQALNELPETIKQDLLDALESLDIEQSLKMINQIKTENLDLAEILLIRVEKFEFEAMVEELQTLLVA